LRQVCTNCTSIWWFRFIPEKDATAEVGFEACIGWKLIVNAVAFQREEEEAIGFDLMTYKYFNVNGKTKPGLETMVRMFWMIK
jgi:vitamin B12 transporter